MVAAQKRNVRSNVYSTLLVAGQHYNLSDIVMRDLSGAQQQRYRYSSNDDYRCHDDTYHGAPGAGSSNRDSAMRFIEEIYEVPGVAERTEVALQVLQDEARRATQEFRSYCKEILERCGYGEIPNPALQQALWDNRSRHRAAPRTPIIVVTLQCYVCGVFFERTVSNSRKTSKKYLDRPCCSRRCSARLCKMVNPNRSKPKPRRSPYGKRR